MADGREDTMAEGLRKLLSTIAQFKAAPDADLDFLQALEGLVVGQIRKVAGATAGAPVGGAAGGGMPGGMGGDMSAPLPPNQIAPGGGMGGMSGLVSPQATNPDELRRVLSGISGGTNG